MFNLQTALDTWRHQYIHNRLFDTEDIDELERHLLDQIEFLTARGYSPEDAFRLSVEELGVFSETESEYRKIFWSKLRYTGALSTEVFWNVSMLKNYLRVTVRTLAKNRVYSLINVLGLTVGVACCLLIFLVVRHELSFDRFHTNADRIYRLNVKWESPEFEFENALTSSPFAPALLAFFPAVQQAVRITPSPEKVLLRVDDTRLYSAENRFIFADPTIFDMFSFGFEGTDKDSALDRPYTMVLTRSMAMSLFGNENPLGRTVRVNNSNDYEVTGIVNDVPITSHFHFDIVASISSLNEGAGPDEENWGSNPYFTYVLLPANYPPSMLEAQFPNMLAERLAENQRKWMSMKLQPLTEIYLNQKGNEIESGSSRSYVTLLWIIACMILAIACFNFINLATARSMTRSREISMRKVAGARRSQLVVQFLTESVLLGTVASALAVGVIVALLPWFSTVTARALELEWSFPFIAMLFIGTLVIGMLAGGYPALVMSKMSPVRLIKGRPDSGSGRRAPRSLRSSLVVFQFAVSIILIVTTIVVFRQLSFMLNTDLGLEPSRVVALPLRSESTREKALLLREQLLSARNVERVAVSLRKPGTGAWGTGFRRPDWQRDDQIGMKYNYIGYDYLETLHIPLVAGRNFSVDHPTDDGTAVIINEKAVEEFGWESIHAAIGQEILSDTTRLTVVGVTANFHFQPMWVEMQPMVMSLAAQGSEYLLIRVAGRDVQNTIADISRIWTSVNPEWPISLSFLDRDYAGLYESESRFGRIFGGFTLLALFIACLGLFGLASFSLERRRKELGLRKALGATGRDIVMLLSIDITKLVLLANLIAWPIAYLGVSKWLENYAFHTTLNVWIFSGAGIAAIAIALMSISYQAVRATQTNAVESLRCD